MWQWRRGCGKRGVGRMVEEEGAWQSRRGVAGYRAHHLQSLQLRLYVRTYLPIFYNFRNPMEQWMKA